MDNYLQNGQNKRRVVVTGMGIVSPCGIGEMPLLRMLIEEKSAIRWVKIGNGNTEEWPVAAVPEWNARKYLPMRFVRRLGKGSQMAVTAGFLAVHAAHLTNRVNTMRLGIIEGTSLAALGHILNAHHPQSTTKLESQTPNWLITGSTGNASGCMAQLLGWHGPTTTLSQGSVSSSVAIGYAYQHLRSGKLDGVLCGGYEAPLFPEVLRIFRRARLLAIPEDGAPPALECRPFHYRRRGFLLGEGAVYFFLEPYQQAKARGVPILAEVIGFAASSDAYHFTSPEPQGKWLARCIQDCLRDARILPEHVDYVNAHGTGTQRNDIAEAQAIQQIFGPPENQPWIGSTKAITGHLLGACGAMEMAIAILALKYNFVPVSLHSIPSDPACELNLVDKTRRNGHLQTILTLNSSFGGRNAALLLRRCSE